MGGASDSPELRRFSIGSSSSSSTESNFRELDDVFLQTQTRIWLGEVLHTRLNEEIVIADLLADGKLLFQVSKVVWKMLLTKCMELRNSKAYICEKAASEKKSWRYMPYSNVDSFLKICKVMGLTSIDLFSPSDVVEKKDSRRVCMCIRSLSKKARSKGLNVPDFDVVTYTVAMPTDMVGGIRRSLEKSQCRTLNSTGSDPCMDSKAKYRQKNWVSDYARQHDSYSEESDDAESNYNVFGFDSPASNASCGDASLLVSSIDNALGGNMVGAENCILRQNISPSDVQDEEKDESGMYEPMRSLEMKGSLRSHHLQNNNHLNTGAVSSPLSTPLSGNMGLGLVNDQGTNASFLGETANEYSSKTSYVGLESGISDFIGHGEANGMVFNFYPGTKFHGSNLIDRSSRYGLLRSFSEEIDDVEVSSSTGSLNSISGKVATIDYEDQFEEDDYLNNQIPQLQNLKTGYMESSPTRDYESLEMVECDSPIVNLTWDTDKRQCGVEFDDIGSATKPLPAAEWLPDSGENIIVSDINGVDVSHVDPESVEDSTGQLQSNYSYQLADNDVLGNMYWDQPDILSGQSNENEKGSIAIVLDNGLGFSPQRSRCPDHACHSPAGVIEDGNNTNLIIPDDMEVKGATPDDPDKKMRENLKNSSLLTDSSSNITEIVTRAMNVVPPSLAIEENEKCDTMYEKRIDCRSVSKERSGLNNSPDLIGTDANGVCSIESQSVKPSSLLMETPSGLGNTYGEANQEDLHVRNDRSVPLIDDIFQSPKLGSLASHLVDESEKFNLEIRRMGSSVEFPICQRGSNNDDAQTLKIVSVDDPVTHHNHDVPLSPCAPKPENEPCETPASSKSVGEDYSDQHLVDVNNREVGHGASINCDKDDAYCTENADNDEEKHEKVVRHTEASKSKPRKILLKSVAGGVTLLGVFLLYQLRRKSGREKMDQTSVPSIQINKIRSGDAPRRNKQQGGSTDKVYPGDKLKI